MAGISFLQQSAFQQSNDFNIQVEGIVTQQALWYNENTPNISAGGRNQLANVVRSPGAYGFTRTIIADAGWALTYDVWATNPSAQDTAILAGVQKAWPLLVGEVQTEPEPAP